jgi:hypothetical protein
MAYKFQIGTAYISGNIELQPDYGLLVDTDSVSDLGSLTKRFANAYVDSYYGDGSNLTGISSDSVDVTGSAYDAALMLVGAQTASASGVGLAVATSDGSTNPTNALLTFNPSSGLLSGSGAIQGNSLSLNGAAAISNQGAVSGVTTIAASGVASLDGGINVNDDFTVDTDGGVVAVGINAGGALTGVTTLAASGLASVASISMDDGSTLGPDSVADLWTFSADGDTTQKDGAYDFDIASHDGTNGLKLAGTLVTSTAAELNYVDVTAGTATESKAVVLDASKDIAGLNDVSAAGLTLSDLDEGGILIAGASGVLSTSVDNLEWTTDREDNNGYIALVVSSSASGSAVLGDGFFMMADEEDEDIWYIGADGAEFAVDIAVDADVDLDGATAIGGTLSFDEGSSQTIDMTTNAVTIQLAEDTSGTNGALLFHTGSGGDFMKFDTQYDYVAIQQDFSASCSNVYLGSGASAAVNVVGRLDIGSGVRYDSVAVKTTTATLDNQDSYVICQGGGSAFTVTLPASPTNGEFFAIKRASTMSADLTISGNGNNIDGQSTIILESAGAAVSVVYDSTGDQWNVF